MTIFNIMMLLMTMMLIIICLNFLFSDSDIFVQSCAWEYVYFWCKNLIKKLARIKWNCECECKYCYVEKKYIKMKRKHIWLDLFTSSTDEKIHRMTTWFILLKYELSVALIHRKAVVYLYLYVIFLERSNLY